MLDQPNNNKIIRQRFRFRASAPLRQPQLLQQIRPIPVNKNLTLIILLINHAKSKCGLNSKEQLQIVGWLIKNLRDNFSDKIDYMNLMVKMFSELASKDNKHLNNFLILVPALSINLIIFNIWAEVRRSWIGRCLPMCLSMMMGLYWGLLICCVCWGRICIIRLCIGIPKLLSILRMPRIIRKRWQTTMQANQQKWNKTWTPKINYSWRN